jgi:hypothetical protein
MKFKMLKPALLCLLIIITDSRRVGLAFTYRFGKAANARKRNDNGSAEEEKGRTN